MIACIVKGEKIFVDSVTRAGLLLNAVRVPHKIFTRLCSEYDPSELWHSQSLWQELGLSDRMTERLAGFISSGWAEKEDDRIYTNGARFITSKSIDYPVRLLELKNPPIGLYIKGSVNLSLPSVAIVGTRKCSAYAEGVAVNLGKASARAGIITISGGARGIDTAGHRGTLDEGGVTVVIFGTGLDKTYPAENKDLFARVLERGAWVSEYPFGTDGNTWRFPERDRLIAAISAHVVVAESPEGGGAMHTAREAITLRRDVWSIPGRITDNTNTGSNMLMREGVSALVKISDFIRIITQSRDIPIDFSIDDAPGNSAGTPELTDDEKIIYSLLQKNGGMTQDEILTDSGLDVMAVSMALMSLESEGLIADNGGRYSAT